MQTHLELGLKTESARRIGELASEVGALLWGEFTLASGKKSNYYFDGKKLTLSPEGAYWVGKAMFDELTKIDVEAVGGLPGHGDARRDMGVRVFRAVGAGAKVGT